MKKLLIAVVAIVIGASVWLVGLKKPAENSIAIVMTISHPALASVRDHFVKTLAATKLGLTIAHYNAEGNLQQANLIAQKIASDKHVVGVFAIGTLAAQTIAKAEKTRPIVYAAVSDPSVLGKPDNNLCGLSDAISPDYQIDTIVKLVPNIKRIGLVYSPSEANSASMVARLAHVLDAHTLPKMLVGIHEPQQIITAATSACKNNDALLIPLDNQLVASMPAVIKATRELPCLVITSNESPIHQGATIAFGVDYQKSGEDAAHVMTTILAQKTTPKRVGIINPQRLDLFVNDTVLEEKRVTIVEESDVKVIHVNGATHG